MKRQLDLVGRALWHLPGSFQIARCLGSYSLRSILVHHVCESDTLFTRGLGVTTTPAAFESVLAFITRYYSPVSLAQVLKESRHQKLPARPVLVTFDDAYSSVYHVAAPICQKYNVPAIFFVNAAFLDNRRLALDNVLCYAINQFGLNSVNAIANEVIAPHSVTFTDMAYIFNHFLPAISLSLRNQLHTALIQMIGIDERELSQQARLYVTRRQVRELVSVGFDIGNHTYSHVNCRSLAQAEYVTEIDKNKTELEILTGRPVESFSVPYGSSRDLPGQLLTHLLATGHRAAFLAESASNMPFADNFQLNRVSVRTHTNAGHFSQIEVLPRFRGIRKLLTLAKG